MRRTSIVAALCEKKISPHRSALARKAALHNISPTRMRSGGIVAKAIGLSVEKVFVSCCQSLKEMQLQYYRRSRDIVNGDFFNCNAKSD